MAQHVAIAGEVLRDLWGVDILSEVILLEKTIHKLSMVDLLFEIGVGLRGTLSHNSCHMEINILVTNINFSAVMGLNWFKLFDCMQQIF